MARIRTVKPEFFTSEDIVSLSAFARLLYIALWCEADKEGRLEWKPRTFKMRYLPADSVDVDALCGELIERRLVVLYGNGLAYIPGFAKHQHINPRESASTLPGPDASARVTHASARDSDAQVGREGKGKEGDIRVDDAPLSGASKGDSEGRKSAAVEIDTWLSSLDGDAIPASDPIFAYAESAGIPVDFLELSWLRFVEAMRDSKKRQKDWRAHYRNAVKGNWHKLWWFSPEGDCRLTTAGEQAKRARA